MDKFSRKLWMAAGALILGLQGCGGDGGAAGSGSSRADILGTPTSMTASGFKFKAGQEPVIQLVEITEDSFQDPAPDSRTFKPSEALPLESGKVYLLTLQANRDPAKTGTVYISNTRSAMGEECLSSAALTTRPCAPKEGREETMPATLVWRAIIDLSVPANEGRQIFITPVTTLVAERARVLTTPRGGNLQLSDAISRAEQELRNSLLPQGAGTPVQVALIEPRMESLGDDVGSRYGLLMGALERLTQQMAKPVSRNDADAGYSTKYDILFASFARDGRFETLQENVQGNSVGLRSVGALLNAALTEHLVKDAPRYQAVQFNNFRAEDFLLSKGALALRQLLATTYSDLLDSSSAAITSIPYVSANETNGATQDHSITAVAARTAGVFFLDSKGEAQDGNKATAQCLPAEFGAPADYEVTGVVALDGAATPTILAFSHTDTKAYLIDVRKIGLDQAAVGSNELCGLSKFPEGSGFRQIDFRDATTQNAALYQSASQYQHVKHSGGQAMSVTLTSATYDVRLNKILISTVDGILAFDVIPATGGTSMTGTLPTSVRYRDFAAFPNNNSNIRIGLGMNPIFDNMSGLIWSPFDYNSSSTGQDDFRGLFALDYSSTSLPFSTNAKAFRTAMSADSANLRNSALTGALNLAHGVGSIAGVYGPPPNNQKECVNDGTAKTLPYNTVRLFNLAGEGVFDSASGSINLNSMVDLAPIGMGQRIVLTNPPTEPQSPGLLDGLSGGLLGGLLGTSEPPAPTEPTRSTEPCTVGYHGVAFENRLRDRNRTASTGLYAIAPVQPAAEFGVRRGLINSVLLSSPRFAQNLNEDGSWKPFLNTKPFVIFQQGSSAMDPRSLVADDIRSYGVLRQRGTFPKSLAYFLVSEQVTPTSGSTVIRYSLVEADLEAISQIPNTLVDSTAGNTSYTVPLTRPANGEAANPIRAYFR
ncbi:MAG TPA: hypothetical protein VFV28_09460 [Limnobacter sp.]|nr:hypothetical protein [Limnobacter sp.]